MKPLAILAILLIALPTVMAADVIERSETFALSDLPEVGTFNFQFGLAENHTVIFDDILRDGKTDLVYNESMYLDNTSVVDFNVTYRVPFFADYDASKNWTLLENTIGVTNTLNSNLLLLKLNFNITHPATIVVNETDPPETTFSLLNAGLLVEIDTFQQAQFNRTHRVTVQAPETELVFVTCGQFITCPPSVRIPNGEEQTFFDAVINIAEGTPTGEYNSFIKLTYQNNTGQIDFKITVRGDDIYNIIRYEVFDDSCFETPEALAKCYKEQAQYNAEVAQALIDSIEKANGTKETRIVNETIKYVEVGNIDPDLLDSFNLLRADYNTLSADYKILSQQVNDVVVKNQELEDKVVSEQQKVIDETAKLSDEFILKRSELEKDAMNAIDEEKDNVRGIFSKVIGTLFFLLLFITIFGVWAEANWVMANFPTKIFFAITIFLGVVWLIVGVWLT